MGIMLRCCFEFINYFQNDWENVHDYYIFSFEKGLHFLIFCDSFKGQGMTRALCPFIYLSNYFLSSPQKIKIKRLINKQKRSKTSRIFPLVLFPPKATILAETIAASRNPSFYPQTSSVILQLIFANSFSTGLCLLLSLQS